MSLNSARASDPNTPRVSTAEDMFIVDRQRLGWPRVCFSGSRNIFEVKRYGNHPTGTHNLESSAGEIRIQFSTTW